MKFLKNKLKILLCIFLSISLLFSHVPLFSIPSMFLAPPGGIYDNSLRLAGNISPAERIHRNASEKYFGNPSIEQIRGYISRIQQPLFKLVNESSINDQCGAVSAVILGVMLQMHFGLEIWDKTYYPYKKPVIDLIECTIPAPEDDPGEPWYATVLRILYGKNTKYWVVPSAYENDLDYKNKIPVMQSKNARERFGISRYGLYSIDQIENLFIGQEEEDIIRKILEEILGISISKDLKVAELMYKNNDVLEQTLKTAKKQFLQRSPAASSL